MTNEQYNRNVQRTRDLNEYVMKHNAKQITDNDSVMTV